MSLFRKPKLKKLGPSWLYALGVILLLVAGYSWYCNQNNKPEKIFSRMLSQSLSTSAVTIKSEQNNGAVVKQYFQYSLGSPNVSRTYTDITQGNTKVRTDTLGTKDADYSRYISIKTDQKGKNGKPLDVSKLVGVWAKKNQGQLFAQTALGTGLPIGGIVVPIANFTPTLRDQLLDQIYADNVYQVDYAKTKKQKVDGRQIYVYSVKIQPVAYARLMKSFAKSLGLHELDTLNPADFAKQQAFEISLSVDAKAGHVTKVEFPQSKFSQTYLGYDVPVGLERPVKTITDTELQKRLSEVR